MFERCAAPNRIDDQSATRASGKTVLPERRDAEAAEHDLLADSDEQRPERQRQHERPTDVGQIAVVGDDERRCDQDGGDYPDPLAGRQSVYEDIALPAEPRDDAEHEQDRQADGHDDPVEDAQFVGELAVRRIAVRELVEEDAQSLDDDEVHDDDDHEADDRQVSLGWRRCVGVVRVGHLDLVLRIRPRQSVSR